jgi:ADP-ribosylation factor-like protein 3
MGLLTLLRKLKTSEREIFILFLGLDGAGKTSCLKKLSDEDISQIQPTRGFNIKTITQQGFKLNVWDIGGQKSIRPYWENYYANADALVYVIDAADTWRVDETSVELNSLLDEKKLAGIPVMVMANKTDLGNAMKEEELGDRLQLHAMRGRDWSVRRTSARTGEGLQEAMRWVIQKIERRRQRQARQGKTAEPQASTTASTN